MYIEVEQPRGCFLCCLRVIYLKMNIKKIIDIERVLFYNRSKTNDKG